MNSHPHNIDDAPGNGSVRADKAENDHLTSRFDWYSPGATSIGNHEDRRTDKTLKKWERINSERYNWNTEREGAWADYDVPGQSHSVTMHDADKERIAHALCNSLDLLDHERDRVLGVMKSINLNAFGQHGSIEKVSLVVIRHVVEQSRNEGKTPAMVANPETDVDLYRISEDETLNFEALVEQAGFGITQTNNLKPTLREELEHNGIEDIGIHQSPHVDPFLPRDTATGMNSPAAENGGETEE